MKNVALYIRVSSDQQAKNGDSLREQEDTLNEYVDSNKNMTIFSTYIDDGISGQKLKRDEFTRLMNDIAAGSIDMILFTKLDRWFRSLKHYLNTQDILEKYEVHWIAVSQPYYDTTTPYGRTFINQVMSFAELEAQMTSERIISINVNKVKEGEVITGSTPLGYSIKDKKLIPNEESRIAIEVFNYYDLHTNLNQTTKFLADKHGILRTPQSIRSMLKNTKYIGEYRQNKNYNPPIIDRDLFESVNRKLKMNTKSNVKHDYLFSGLLCCGNCSRKMNSGRKSNRSPKRKDGTCIVYPPLPEYTCRYAYQLPKCENTKVIREHLLEKYLIENLPALLQLTINSLKKQKNSSKNTQARIKTLEKKIERLKLAYLNEIITLEEYKIDKADLEKELTRLSKPSVEKQKIEGYEKLLNSDLNHYYGDMSRIEKKAFWQSLIAKLTFDNQRLISVEML
ncbi:recombinase family protein [Enterococcus sp. N249-2]